METRIVQIETATNICSVTLTNNGENLAHRESQIKNSHSNLITTFITEVLKEASTDFSEIDAVAVSGGPGSYTGIRIGMAVAKGICFSLDVPLIKICTLQTLAWAAMQEQSQEMQDCWFVPAIDARRMEIFTAVYDSNLKEVLAPQARIVDDFLFNDILPQRKLLFVGNGSYKCKDYSSKHIKGIKNVAQYYFVNKVCSGKWLSALAYKAFTQNKFVDLQLTTADYYKDFYTTFKTVNN